MKQIEQLTEIEIISSILNGEKSLYEIIIRRFNSYLYKIGRSYNYNHEDTQDLMQDTFIDAYKSISSFEGRALFKTWISRIMINHCYKKRQKSSFKNEIMHDIHDQAEPMFTNNAQQHPEKSIQNYELGHIIEKALATLPLEYRMVFSLREINAMSTAETAELLNISEANVKVRLNRAKNTLQAEIKKSYAATELFEFNLVYCNAIVDRVMTAIQEL